MKSNFLQICLNYHKCGNTFLEMVENPSLPDVYLFPSLKKFIKASVENLFNNVDLYTEVAQRKK